MTEEQIEQGEAQENATDVEETVEETEETTDTPTLEDFYRLQKEVKTLKAQKEHFKKKAQTQTKESETLKTNQTSNDLLLMQKEILSTKGFSDATIEQAQRLSEKLGISIIEAVKDPLISTFAEKDAIEEKKRKAQLGASSGSSSNKAEIRPGMSEEEHRAAWAKAYGRS